MGSTANSEGRAEAWRGFDGEPLDWPLVARLFERHMPSALGLRALAELAPRADAGAREALARAREMESLLAGDDTPALEGGEDPIPELRLAVRYGRTLDGENLVAIARLIRGVDVCQTWAQARREIAPACARLLQRLPDLDALQRELARCLGPQGQVADSASPRLGDLRREMARLQRSIEGTLRALAQDPGLRNFLAPGQAARLHRRGKRLCLAVRTRNAGQVPGVVHDRSQSGETIFVEPRAVIESSNRLAALEADERQEIQLVLSQLTRAVFGRKEDILGIAERLGEMELALASARYARDVDGRVPRLPGEEAGGATTARGLQLSSARHPLLVEQQREGRLEEVVPIDLRLGDDFDLLVVTGPNTGGKTLALKTAGLAALCCRMGLAFPCGEGTTVPLYDAVLVDIGDEQEVEQNLSTFSSHIARVQASLRRATSRSLVLLDELGGGTDPVEGAALSDALLEHFLAQGVQTLATTHLGQLKEFAYRNPRAENAHAEFDLETLAPRFRLVIGAPGESRALAIARRLGFPPEILDAAEGRLVRPEGDAERLMGDLREVRLEAERVRLRADQRLREAEEQELRVRSEAAQLEERRSQVEAEAQRGLEERLARARAVQAKLQALLPQLASAPRKQLQGLLGELDQALGDALLSERRREFLETLKKGAFVWVPRLKKRCQITRIHRADRRLWLKLGKQVLELSFDDVTFYESL